MSKSLILIGAVIFLTCSYSFSQEKLAKTNWPRPATGSYTNVIPGYFIVDFGFNQALNAPGAFDVEFWGSRTANVYYAYPIRIAKSSFSFVPSVGLSMERFKLANGNTLSSTLTNNGTRGLVSASQLYGHSKLIKSMIVTNYVDLPLGLRFDTNPDDLSRSFFVSLGMRVGVLYESFTRIKYNEGGESKLEKHRQSYNINLFRYGAFARVGIAGFSLFVDYNISPYFEQGKGPQKTGMNTITFGISVGNL